MRVIAHGKETERPRSILFLQLVTEDQSVLAKFHHYNVVESKSTHLYQNKHQSILYQQESAETTARPCFTPREGGDIDPSPKSAAAWPICGLFDHWLLRPTDAFMHFSVICAAAAVGIIRG